MYLLSSSVSYSYLVKSLYVLLSGLLILTMKLLKSTDTLHVTLTPFW